MNKEQFKKSISNLIFHYVGNMISYEQQLMNADDYVRDVIRKQAGVLNGCFNATLDEIINGFVGEEDESQVSGEE